MQTVKINLHTMSKFAIMHAFLTTKQEVIPFDKAGFLYKKTEVQARKMFKDFGGVPNWAVVDDFFCLTHTYTYKFKGRIYENISFNPIVSARGRFGKYSIQSGVKNT